MRTFKNLARRAVALGVLAVPQRAMRPLFRAWILRMDRDENSLRAVRDDPETVAATRLVWDEIWAEARPQ